MRASNGRSPLCACLLALCASLARGTFVPRPTVSARPHARQRHAFSRTPAAVRAALVPEDPATASGPEHDAKVDKALKAMVGFSNSYCKNTDTRYCADPSIPAVVIKGLAEHKVVLGAPLCPCRHYEDKQAEAKDGYWNCPCVPMRERHECHCMLFLTTDNEFSGDNQKITLEECVEHTSGMSIL